MVLIFGVLAQDRIEAGLADGLQPECLDRGLRLLPEDDPERRPKAQLRRPEWPEPSSRLKSIILAWACEAKRQ